MIVLDVEQGSPEWLAARIGIPTASRFSDVMTPKTLKYAAAAAKYRSHILAEWSLGYPIQDDPHRNGYMERGKDLEAEARRWYEMERDVEVAEVGFVLRNDRRVGGSPDGLVDDDGGAEIKVPAAHTHLLYVLDTAELTEQYRPQVQGYMYLTGRKWWDIVSYNPVLPKVLVRVERDENFITHLHRNLGRFLSELDAAKRQILALGYRPPEWITLPPEETTVEALVDQLYGPEPVKEADPREATEAEMLKLRQLRSLADGLDLSIDAQAAIADALKAKDAQAVGAWTRKLEREIGAVR